MMSRCINREMIRWLLYWFLAGLCNLTTLKPTGCLYCMYNYLARRRMLVSPMEAQKTSADFPQVTPQTGGSGNVLTHFCLTLNSCAFHANILLPPLPKFCLFLYPFFPLFINFQFSKSSLTISLREENSTYYSTKSNHHKQHVFYSLHRKIASMHVLLFEENTQYFDILLKAYLFLWKSKSLSNWEWWVTVPGVPSYLMAF